MKKVLVPTDFSVSSTSGIQFAIHWATQQKIELVFIHVLYVLRATRWSDTYYEKYAQQQEKLIKTKFEKFITEIYQNMNIEPGKYSIIMVKGFSPDLFIMDYCVKNPSIDCICISTRGAGKFKKIFGTNTGNLITKAPVPVLAVPNAYKIAPLSQILYATDLRNYADEVKKVVGFALPFKASIEVLHITWPREIAFDEKTIESAFKKNYKYGLKIRFEKNDGAKTVLENIKAQIKKTKPSIVIMFTNPNRTIFNRIFQSSKSEQLSFEAKVPLLIFNKV